MPKIRRKNRPKPPAGWDIIEGTLNDLEAKMREAEADPHEGKRKAESVWPILRIHHQRSRYLYEMYHRKRAISRELLDYCIREKYADGALIAKWKKAGYERLCCLRCIQTRDHNYSTACICRVPRNKLDADKVVECIHCGCRGCASGDAGVAEESFPVFQQEKRGERLPQPSEGEGEGIEESKQESGPVHSD